MMNAKTLFQHLQKEIALPEDPQEISSMLYLLFEKEFGLSRTDIMAEKEVTEVPHERLKAMIQRINQNEPIQYILEEERFAGRTFLVNHSVLIPRPETEMIVRLVKEERHEAPRILDIGTGSGCIAISIALDIPTAHVTAIDISDAALNVAKENALRLGAFVTFEQMDFLNQSPSLKNLDLIVSNPPYILQKERVSMQANVLSYEPALALFVPDHNPLLFYKEIAKKGKQLLRPGGKIIVEINEKFGQEVKQLFEQKFYRASIFTDINGKDRVVVAQLS
jgi:release factor glutamine methyltransferase